MRDYRELSDAIQTIANDRLEKVALYAGESARRGTTTPPAQPTTYHTISDGASITVESLRQSVLTWSPTPVSLDKGQPSSQVYGGVHLLRLLVLLPNIFNNMKFKPEEAALIKSMCASLQKSLEAQNIVKRNTYQ